LQYAHARICSIFRQAEGNRSEEIGIRKEGQPNAYLLTPDSLDLSPLVAKEERDLMKRLALFPQVLLVCAQEDSPHPLVNYLLVLARQFHHFYDHHRVLSENAALTRARLALLQALRGILGLGLNLLRVSAPESM